MMLFDLTNQDEKKLEKNAHQSAEASSASTETNGKTVEMMKSTDTQNIILYGPPGTGKTYDTKRQALKLLMDNNEFENITQEDIPKLFSEYQKKGQIEFVTFHQSYGLRRIY